MQYGAAGDFFFHYTTADTAFRHILPNRTLQLSPYSKMRDPLEAKDWHVMPAGFVPEGSNIDRDLLHSYGLAQAAKQQCKLLSLSIDAPYCTESEAFGRGYALASMWELYADKHAGVCLVFDRQRLTAKLMAEPSAAATLYHKPVRYRRAGLAESSGARTLILEAGTPDLEALVRRHIDAYHEDLLFTKLLDWEHEAEYRFVIVSPGSELVRCNYGDALQAVIVGHAFPDWQVPSALTLCAEAGADAKKLLWEMSRPLVINLRRLERTPDA